MSVRCPFVFLTAFNQREETINGKRAGADEYLVKPIDFDLPLARIEARLGQIGRMNDEKHRELQTAIAQSLASGRPPDQIAAELGVSQTTIAFHMRNIFQKADTHRQADLIALVLTGIATIEPGTAVRRRAGLLGAIVWTALTSRSEKAIAARPNGRGSVSPFAAFLASMIQRANLDMPVSFQVQEMTRAGTLYVLQGNPRLTLTACHGADIRLEEFSTSSIWEAAHQWQTKTMLKRKRQAMTLAKAIVANP